MAPTAEARSAAAIPRTIRELRAVAQASGLRVVEARADLGSGEGATAGVTELAAELLAGPRPPDAVFTVASFAAVGAFQLRRLHPRLSSLIRYWPHLTGSVR